MESPTHVLHLICFFRKCCQTWVRRFLITPNYSESKVWVTVFGEHLTLSPSPPRLLWKHCCIPVAQGYPPSRGSRGHNWQSGSGSDATGHWSGPLAPSEHRSSGEHLCKRWGCWIWTQRSFAKKPSVWWCSTFRRNRHANTPGAFSQFKYRTIRTLKQRPWTSLWVPHTAWWFQTKPNVVFQTVISTVWYLAVIFATAKQTSFSFLSFFFSSLSTMGLSILLDTVC